MPIRGTAPDVVRVIEGVSGAVPMAMDLVVRFDYGSTVPWVRRLNGTPSLVPGPAPLELSTPVPLHRANQSTKAAFSVRPGARVPFALPWPAPTEAGQQPERARDG